MVNNNTFDKLKTILNQFEQNLSVLHDKTDNYYLNTPTTDSNKKAEFFGAVQKKKSYVAFHLMPVYYFPNLLDNISPELKKKCRENLASTFNLLTKIFFPN